MLVVYPLASFPLMWELLSNIDEFVTKRCSTQLFILVYMITPYTFLYFFTIRVKVSYVGIPSQQPQL